MNRRGGTYGHFTFLTSGAIEQLFQRETHHSQIRIAIHTHVGAFAAIAMTEAAWQNESTISWGCPPLEHSCERLESKQK